jgi:hypothetical protein
MGPLGVLEHLVDGQVTRYEPQYGGATGVTPAKIEVSQRDAFQSLPATARSVVDGSSASPPWTPVEALGIVGPQLVSICDSQPRVFTGGDWRTYPGVRVLANQLSQDVFHTSNTTKQATDDAYLAGVTFSVWTESTTVSTGTITTSMFGIKAANGAWLVTPTVLMHDGTVGHTWGAKVVEDGSHFFVFFNSSATQVTVRCYSTAGAQLGTDGSITPHSSVIGNWDVVAASAGSPGTVLFAICVSTSADSGVSFASVGFNGTSLVITGGGDATILGAGRIAFITNDLANGHAYLATKDSTDVIQGYEISTFAQTQHFASVYTIPTDAWSLDTITGFTEVGGDGVDIVLSIGLLPNTTDPISDGSGPPVDPQLRWLQSILCNRSSTKFTLRVTQSLCQVSRAFAIDGEYYVFAYYQSGSGIGLLPQVLNVTITDGDYFIGAGSQPLTVRAGDMVFGSPAHVTEAAVSSGGITVFVSSAKASTAVLLNDSVAARSALNMSQWGIPDGTPLMLWTLANLTTGTNHYGGSRLTLTGATALNSTFEVLGDLGQPIGSTQFYTLQQDTFGNGIGNTTFGGGGTFVMTKMVCYLVSDLSTFVPSDEIARAVFVESNGTIVVTGASGSGNNGTFQIQRIRSPLGSAGSSAAWPSTPAGISPTYTFGSALNSSTTSQVWVSFVSQTQETVGAGFTAIVNPSSTPNTWFFGNGEFDATYVGADLTVSSDPALASNVGTYVITAAPSANSIVTGGATSIISQIFDLPFPVVSIDLTTQIPYTFKLQSLGVPDFTFQGALVSVQGADPTNNGVYQIVQINADGTFIATPSNGLSNQVNEAFFAAGPVTITIFFAQNIQPEFQPTWFIVPLTGSQPVVGRFEYGLAYADWRIESDNTRGPNLFPMAVASPALTPTGWEIVLPYRAQNVTAATLETTPAGEVNIVAESFVSTVGLKVFTLANTYGKPEASNGELSIPGPMAVVYTPSGFLEDGQNLAPEAPFLVSQAVGTTGQLALTLGGIYFIVAVLEFSDENGNRTYSPPSPALQVNMSLTNNVATYGGRLPYPLSPTGTSPANFYGPTTRLAGISLYRTAFINGVPTTQHYKITNDLNVNGLAPATTLNASGFSFPDTFTWNYVDQNPDAGLNANEILYTDKSLLPRYPAPAGPNGPKSWKKREWIIGYDDAVWMSGEKTEGDAVWYNPAFRFPFPAEDAPVGLSGMDDYLIVTCEASVWYIPAAQFPDATGGNGGLPTPVRLPFPNGSRNGFAETIRDGVAYDSTDGGVWLVTRQLENKWLSHPLQTTIGDGPILGMAVDQAQRLFVMLFITEPTDPSICVYDGIPQCWYEWVTPSTPKLLATYNGQACYEDNAVVAPVVPGAVVDIIAGVSAGIAGPDVSTQEMNFGNTRGLKKVWEFQGVGTYKGPHNANAVLSYPEDGWPTSNYAIMPTSLFPYILAFNPNPEDASTYKIRIFPDFTGVGSPGATFSIEMISAQVGVEPVGISKLPAYVIMKGK